MFIRMLVAKMFACGIIVVNLFFSHVFRGLCVYVFVFVRMWWTAKIAGNDKLHRIAYDSDKSRGGLTVL